MRVEGAATSVHAFNRVRDIAHLAARPCVPASALRRSCCTGADKHNTSVWYRPVNSKQMKKWLEQQGATFQPGKGSHLKVFLNGKQSTPPMHGTAEPGKGLEAAIKRQLGLN
jgi:mRNA interferase HicA